uniref:AMP-binding domain-containing protein n=1 Tax=Heterorhabditis bacteriophora TaxID=37862 RepID=A0A1I7XFG7_HETBA
MKFVYRGRIAVFSVSVLRDERIVIVAEQKPGSSEEDAFNWMSRVLQAIDTIHQVGIYCLALVPANQLPKTPLGGIHVAETRHRFQSGELHPSTLLMCPHSCVLNLPKPRERQSDVGPAAMLVGNLVQGVRIAGAQGRNLGPEEDTSYSLLEILRSRAESSPDHRLFTLVTGKSAEQDTFTCASLLKLVRSSLEIVFLIQMRAERVGALLTDRARLNPGDHVALIFHPGLDLIAAFYGCLVAGLVPICLRPPSATSLQSTLPTVRMIVDVSKAVAILSNSFISKLLKSKEAAHRVDSKAWPMIIDIEDSPSSWKRKTTTDLIERSSNDICYLVGNTGFIINSFVDLDFSVSTTGQLAGVVVSSTGVLSICKSLKISCELYPSRHVALCLDPYSGIGFVLWCLSSVYSGHHTTLIPPMEVETQPALWLTTVSQLKSVLWVQINTYKNIWVHQVQTLLPYTLMLVMSIQSFCSLHLIWNLIIISSFYRESKWLLPIRKHGDSVPTPIWARFGCHKHLGDCAVFTWTHLVVVVAECLGAEAEALDLVPAVTSAVLEEHHLIVGVVVIVDPHTVPVNSRGEKQRNLLREQFLHDQLDPIYVAYNM